MLPKIQLDDKESDILDTPVLYSTYGNCLVCLNLADIKKFKYGQNKIAYPAKYSNSDSKSLNPNTKNMIKSLNTLQIFEFQDVKDFKKKESILTCFSEYVFKNKLLFNRNMSIIFKINRSEL
jgi:hypothetical protein